MSTFTVTSRYPRPLKATQTFHHQQELYQAYPSLSSSPSFSPPSLASKSWSSLNSSSETSRQLPQPLNNDNQHFTNKELTEQSHPSHSSPFSSSSPLLSATVPRRSNSLSSLEEYSQIDGTAISDESGPQADHYTHKRSNSADGSNIAKPQRGSIRGHHTRKSIEGLNQEVSFVLEGKSLDCLHSHPDGHIAPVHELLRDSHRSSHSFSLSPREQVPSPSSPRLNESPIIVDIAPSLPKIAFGREPPIGAERCKINQNLLCFSDGCAPRPPDKSKANIVFKGNVFSPPLLPSHGLQTVNFI